MIEKSNGGKTLDALETKYKLYEQKDTFKAWKEASANFAKSASGEVTAFVSGASKKDVFRSVELKELVSNDKVTNINGVSRSDLQKAFGKNPDKAFAMVCAGELKQAREKLNQLPSDKKPEFEKQLRGREQAFNAFLKRSDVKFDKEQQGSLPRAPPEQAKVTSLNDKIKQSQEVNRLAAFEKARESRMEKQPTVQRGKPKDKGKEYE